MRLNAYPVTTQYNVGGFPASTYIYTFYGIIDELKIYTAVVPP